VGFYGFFLGLGNFWGVNNIGEMLRWGVLAGLPYKIIFNCLIFSMPNFLCGDVPGELSSGFFCVFSFLEGRISGESRNLLKIKVLFK